MAALAQGATLDHVARESYDIKSLAQFYQEVYTYIYIYIFLLFVCSFGGVSFLQVLGFEEIESPKFEFGVIWLKLSPNVCLHLIERDIYSKLPESPYTADDTATVDTRHLYRGHHLCFSVSNFDSFVQALKVFISFFFGLCHFLDMFCLLNFAVFTQMQVFILFAL